MAGGLETDTPEWPGTDAAIRRRDEFHGRAIGYDFNVLRASIPFILFRAQLEICVCLILMIRFRVRWIQLPRLSQNQIRNVVHCIDIV